MHERDRQTHRQRHRATAFRPRYAKRREAKAKDKTEQTHIVEINFTFLCLKYMPPIVKYIY